MKLSIVIPTKNEEVLLPKLLKSIREQTFQDFEVIVADAKSTDKTRSIAASYGAHVVDGGMPGPGRNRGAAMAQGEIVVFFDADVVLPTREFLGDCMNEMSARVLDAATCRVYAYDGKMIDRALHGAYNAYTIATERIRPHAPGFCLFAKRSVHEDIHGFDEDVVFAEDHDYVQRAKRKGYTFGILRKHMINASVRRMEKEGRTKVVFKYVFSEFFMLTKGPFKHRTPFRYEFGHSKKKDQV